MKSGWFYFLLKSIDLFLSSASSVGRLHHTPISLLYTHSNSIDFNLRVGLFIFHSLSSHTHTRKRCVSLQEINDGLAEDWLIAHWFAICSENYTLFMCFIHSFLHRRRHRHLYVDTIISCSNKSNQSIFGILDIVNKWVILNEKWIKKTIHY